MRGDGGGRGQWGGAAAAAAAAAAAVVAVAAAAGPLRGLRHNSRDIAGIDAGQLVRGGALDRLVVVLVVGLLLLLGPIRGERGEGGASV